MNQDHWYFEIDHKNTIRFDLQTKVSDVFRYVEMEVMLCSENKEEILVFSDFLIVALRELKWPLEQLLAGSFKLHYSVTKDIGYLWNESLHGIELPSKKN